jgi:AmmeMemoRadiSam system protein B
MNIRRRAELVLFYLLASVIIGAGGKPMSYKTIRKANGAGRWFSGDGKELLRDVKGYIDRAEVPAIDHRLVGAVAPHAGYLYSGAVAGCSFRALRDNAKKFGAPDVVVVLGLSHRGGFAGVALMDGDAIATPLGVTELDRASGVFLAGKSESIYFDYAPHAVEHSAENEIPFVQVALPDAKLVVGLLGDHSDKTWSELAGALHKLAEKHRIVIVASSDLLHDADYELVTRTDHKTLGLITSLDVSGLESSWSIEHQVCCGIGPVVTLLRFVRLQGVESGRLLCYRNSGDDHPESRGEWVVGYGAVVF